MLSSLEQDFHLGEWRVRPQLNELQGPEAAVRLEHKSMQVLVYLAQHHGKVCGKKRLIEAIWGEVFVTDEVLTYAIWQLRKALGDDAKKPRFIQTVPKKGYRLIAAMSRLETPPSDPRAQTVSHYRLLERLGEGGMGEVYRAEDQRLEREVALKFLGREVTQDSLERKRFVREARAASSLEHPNIGAIYDIDESEDGRLFIAMAYYCGETLKRKIEREPIPRRQALDLAAQVADGLARAHDRGIVHRDVKPDNIVVTDDGLVKIIDFGLAKLRGASRLTKSGSSPGTPAYMSPEQIRGEEVDARSDVWSLGVVLYETLTGHLPFRGDNDQALIYSILNETPDALTEWGGAHPRELDDLVTRCLEKLPARRMPSARELAAQLRSLDTKRRVEEAETTRREKSRRSPLRILQASSLTLAGGLTVLLLLALLDVGGWRTRMLAGAGQERIESVAVLPLEDLTGDPQQAFFADGMTEALITELARVGSLKVISRTSAMQYADTDKLLPEIARELGVDAIVEGSILRSGERVRITAQLIHGVSDEHLWTAAYERDLADVLKLQREVAAEITREIRGTLTPQEAARLAATGAVRPEAHEAYLWGRHYWNRRTQKDLLQARDYFQAAIDGDPAYAAAYAGLADTHTLLGVYGTGSRREGKLAKASAMRALELEPDSAQGHKALGYVLFVYEWDWEAAERTLRRAVELSPSDADSLHWYATFLMCMGRPDEATTYSARARELDPLSPVINAGVGLVHMFARRYDAAVAALESLLMKVPDFAPARLYLSHVHLVEGRLEEAISELESLNRADGSSEQRAHLAAAYATAGFSDEALLILDDLTDPPSSGLLPLALAWFQMGEREEAFRWLDEAHRRRVPSMIQLSRVPWLDPMRSDPRYQEILRRLRFPTPEGRSE